MASKLPGMRFLDEGVGRLDLKRGVIPNHDTIVRVRWVGIYIYIIFMYIYICVCIFIYLFIHTNVNTQIYIYIFRPDVNCRSDNQTSNTSVAPTKWICNAQPPKTKKTVRHQIVDQMEMDRSVVNRKEMANLGFR